MSVEHGLHWLHDTAHHCLRWYHWLALVLALVYLANRRLRYTERLLGLAFLTSRPDVVEKCSLGSHRLSLMQGTVSLRSLRIRPEFINSLDLPFLCTSVSVGQAEVRLHWRTFFPRALSVCVSDVCIEAATRQVPQNCSVDVWEREREDARHAQRAAKLLAVEGILWGERPPKRLWESLKNACKRHASFQLMRVLEVEVHNFSLVIALDKALPGSREAAGPPPGPAEGIGSRMQLRVRSLAMHNACAGAYGVLATDVGVKGVSLDVEQPSQLPSSFPAAPRVSVVRRWSVGVQIGWRLASGFFDRVERRKTGEQRVPVLQVHIAANALLLYHDPGSLRTFLGLAASVLHYTRYSSFTRLRPQVAVDLDPQAWWQHAGRIILAERSAVLGADAHGRSTAHRARLRRTYEELYMQQRSSFRWFCLALIGRCGQQKAALQALEGRLSDAEAAQFRWWAWALRRRRAAASRAQDVSTELAESLEAINNVLAARGRVRQKRSRPLRARLSVACPKVGVAMEVRGIVKGASGGGAFVVAAKELHASILAGSQVKHQLQSGAGPLTVEASCEAFHISHTPAMAEAAANMAAEPQESPLWLVKSPSGDPTRDFMLSQKGGKELFVRISYVQPALRAAQPSRVRLKIAPIDVIYSQVLLLQLAAFLDAAWPPPALDPLTVRTSITLEEIVAERLVGPLRGQQAQKLRQSRQQLEIRAGEIRLMLPCGESVPPDMLGTGRTAAMFTDLDPEEITTELLDVYAQRTPMCVLVLGGFSASTINLAREGGDSMDSPRGTHDIESGDIESYLMRQSSGGDLGTLENPLRSHSSPGAGLAAFSPGLQRELSGVKTEGLRRTTTLGRDRKLQKEAWMQRRFEESSLEKLQVRVTVHAFLGRPNDSTLQAFQDEADIVEQFTICTAVDHAAERAAFGSYRRIVQVEISTTDVYIKVTQFVKRELHSLVVYLHSSFSDQVLAANIARPFAQREINDHVFLPPNVAARAPTAHPDTMPTRRSYAELRSAPSVSGLAESQAEGSELGTDQGHDGAQGAGYGLVLSLQVNVPSMVVDVIESLNAENPDHVRALFQLRLSELQLTLAAEDSLHNVRFAIGSCALEDVTADVQSALLLRATPRMADARRSGARPQLQRCFQAWRMQVAARTTRARAARDSLQHLLLTPGAQLSGHIVLHPQSIVADLDSSFVCASLELATIRRMVAYAQELAAAQPRTAFANSVPSSKEAAAVPITYAKAAGQRSRPAAALHADPTAASVDGRGTEGGPRGILPGCVTSSQGTPGDKRSVSIRTSLYLAHVTLVMEQRRFATLVASDLVSEYNCVTDSPEHDLLVECSGLQVLDRLARAPHLSEVLCISDEASSSQAGDDPSSEGLVEPLLRMSHVVRKVFHAPVHSYDATHGRASFATEATLPGGLMPTRRRPGRRNKQMQAATRVQCDGLRLVAVSRFLYNCQAFCGEVQSMLALLSPAPPEIPPKGSPMGYRPITEVVLNNAVLDLPRDSCSREMYRIRAASMRAVAPMSQAQLDRMKPNMDAAPEQAPAENSVAVSLAADWAGTTNLGSSQVGEGASPFAAMASAAASDSFLDGSLPFSSLGPDDDRQVHHWWDGAPVATAVHLGPAAVDWLLVDALGQEACKRQSWDSSQALISLDESTSFIKVWMPWVQLVVGEAQFRCAMAFLWENMFEDADFGPPRPAIYPTGVPRPTQPPQPERLGVDKSQGPTWELQLNVRSLVGHCEGLNPGPERTGSGPTLGKARMRDVQITCGTYACGSMSNTVACSGLRIHDLRGQTASQAASTPGPQAPASVFQDRGAAPSAPSAQAVVAIGAEWADLPLGGSPVVPQPPEASLADLNQRRTSSKRWSQLREAVEDGLGPFAPPTRLTERSTFQWDSISGFPGSPTSHRRMSSFRDAEGGEERGRRLRSQSFASAADRLGLRTVEVPALTPAASEQPGSGFMVEYVMQANPRASPEEPVVWGPHVAEIVMQGAALSWPFAHPPDLIWEIQQVFTHYVFAPWVAPYPIDPTNYQWMYCNLVMEASHLFLPLADPQQEASAGSQGLFLEWQQFRAGYFFGGDGQYITRLNAFDLGAWAARSDGTSQMVARPFKFAAEAQQTFPASQALKTSSSLLVKASRVGLRPAFGHVPLVQAAIRILQATKAQEPTGIVTEFDKGPFRADSLRVTLALEQAGFALVDDRYGNNIEVAALQLQDVDFTYGREVTLPDTPPTTFGNISLALEVVFLNSAVDATDPLIDSWPFKLEYRHNGQHRQIMLHSAQRLNMIVTPAAFRSVGDVRSFAHLLLGKPAALGAMPAAAARAVGSWLGLGKPRITSLYRLVNRSGLRLSYWVDGPEGRSNVFYINSWEEGPLQVEPLEKTVVLTESQLQVTARTISMQFEGNWTAVADVIVDKVGKYAHVIGSPLDTASTPVVMDVSLDVRTKVLTIHSPFRIENHTSASLEFVVHLFSSPHLRGGSPTSTVPSAGPLLPNLQCYLPTPAVWGGVMYMRAVGWDVGRKDKIDLDGPSLKEKQGLYACPPLRDTDRPFHCALEVHEELIKTSLKARTAGHLPEYILRFQPPLVIHNVLPVPVLITLADSSAQGFHPQISIAVGDSVEVYHFDMSRKIRMTVQMEDYSTGKPVTIHYPPSQYLDDSTRRSVLADLPGLKLPKSVLLSKDPGGDGSAASRRFRNNTHRLILRIHNKMHAHSRARQVVLSAPYWVVNKTNLEIQVHNTTPNGGLPIIAQPGLDTATAVPFSSSRGSMRLGLESSSWSRAINLETLGMHANIHVHGPSTGGQPPSPGGASEAQGALEAAVLEAIAPRSASPTRRRNAGRLGRRLGSLTVSGSFDSPMGDSRRGAASFALPPREPVESPSEAGSPTRPGLGVASKLGIDCTRPATVQEGEEEVQESRGDDRRRYEFALESNLGPSMFHRTKVITITSRYMVLNNSGEVLEYGQRGTKLVAQLPPGCRHPFHWRSIHAPFQLCVRPAGDWNWSGAFTIDSPAEVGLRVHKAGSSQCRLLPVDVSNNGAAVLVTVGKANAPPPYRIENRCDNVRLKFQQKDLDTDEWEALDSLGQVDYAWDEPMAAHRLRVMLDTDGTFRDVGAHEYNLDVIRAHPVIKLRRANVKIVHKVATTMGRAISTGMNIATKSGLNSAASGALPPASPQDQPELDAKYVYAGVHADGPTRVLCFSTTRDEYTRGTNEDSIALLTAKLKRLEHRLKDVNATLQSHDTQNIDMSLAMSLEERGSTSLHAPLDDRPTARTLDDSISLRKSLKGHTQQGAAVGASAADLEANGSPRGAQDHPLQASGSRVSQLLRHSIVALKEIKHRPLFTSSQDGADARTVKPLEGGVRPLEGASQSLPTSMHSHPPLPPSLAPGSPVEARSSSLFEADRAAMEPERGYKRTGSLQLPASPFENGLPRQISKPVAEMESFLESPTRRSRSVDPDIGSLPSTSTTSMAGSFPSSFQSTFPEQPSRLGGSHRRTGSAASASNPLSQRSEITAVEAGLPRPPEKRTSLVASKLGLGSGSLGAVGLGRLKRRNAQKPSGDLIIPPEELQGNPQGLLNTLSAASSCAQPRDEMLGGELVVQVVEAQGLMAAWRHREAQQAQLHLERPSAFRAAARRLTGPKRGDVYCTLSCEGQVKRTGLAAGFQHPTWKEELNFKAVQISSDLLVTVLGRGRLGGDVFLGDAVIPLREVENFGASEVRRYTLGRRSTREKVSGDISLTCTWRVTPLDMAALKVKTRQSELDRKEEVLALLLERTGAPSPQISPMGPVGSLVEPGGTLAVVSSPPGGLAEQKRLMASRGALSLKIIEARNLTVPADVLHAFFTMDAYIVAGLNSEAGTTSRQTKVARNTLVPAWQERLGFNDVALGDTVSLAIFDHKKLTSDVFLGQAMLPVSRFQDGKPRYLWVSLQSPQGPPRTRGSDVATLGSLMPVCDLHIRVQWTRDEPQEQAEASPSFTVEVGLCGIGISMVDASSLRLPREVVHALLEDIHLDYKFSAAAQASRFAIASVQLDNQLLTTGHPVVLGPTHQALPATPLVESAGEAVMQLRAKPFLDVQWEMLNHNPSILYFKHITLQIQEMDLVLEEDFLDLVGQLSRKAPMQEIWQQVDAFSPSGSAADLAATDLQELLDATTAHVGAPRRIAGRKWYFEKLEVAAIRCNLTMVPHAGARDDSDNLGARYRVASALGIPFMEINGVPLRINPMQLKNAFVTPQALMKKLSQHLYFQALRETHKILSQVDILGSPIVLGASLAAGLQSFVREPLKARNPVQFVVGLGHGSRALLQLGTYGLFNAVSQLLGGTAKGLALLTVDQEYISRFRTRPGGQRQRVLWGVQAAGVGLWEGIIGIVREPLQGWEDDRFLGLLVGILLGASGALLKPASGFLDCVAKILAGIGAGIRSMGEDMVKAPRTRIRAPRQFASLIGGTGDAQFLERWRGILDRSKGGRFKGAVVTDYLQNKEAKAVVLTSTHVLYLDLARQRIRWHFSLANLTSVSTTGLVALLHHQLTLRLTSTARAHVPVRKRVECRTRDVHQALLLKLSGAMAHMSGEALEETSPRKIRASQSLHQGSLLIMNQQRPTPQPSPRAPIQDAEASPEAGTPKALPRASPRSSPRGSMVGPASQGSPLGPLKRASIGPSRLARESVPAGQLASTSQGQQLQPHHSAPVGPSEGESAAVRFARTSEADGGQPSSASSAAGAAAAATLQAVAALCDSAAQPSNSSMAPALLRTCGLLATQCLEGQPEAPARLRDALVSVAALARAPAPLPAAEGRHMQATLASIGLLCSSASLQA